MALDPVRDEKDRQEYEASYAADRAEEFEQLKRAVEMLILAGHLSRGRLEQALALVKK